MIHSISYDNEIRIWWDRREDKRENMRYKVTLDGGAYILTDKHYYDFPNLEQGREYLFTLELVDEERRVIGRTERIALSTLAKRTEMEVTDTPYNVKADGKTDNTAKLQQALKDNTDGKRLHFPFGVYICEELDFSGNIDLCFDVGAILCSAEKEKEL